MPQLTIPIGCVIDKTDSKNTVKIRVPNTRFWVEGIRKEKHKWDLYMIDAGTFRDKIESNITTSSFALFSNTTLKTPFPYIGKKAQNSSIIKKFLKKINKKNGKHNKQ